MAYFSSEYECKLDAKGRMVLPAKIKGNLPEETGNKIAITRGFEPCLVIYPLNEWDKVFEKVSRLSEFHQEYRLIQRNFLRGFTDAELDNNGRFLIPKTMLAYAKIEKNAIVVGLGNRVEVWNPEVYDDYLIKDQVAFSALAQKYLVDDDTENNLQ